MEMPPKRALVGLSGRFLNFSPHRVVTTQSLLHYKSLAVVVERVWHLSHCDLVPVCDLDSIFC